MRISVVLAIVLGSVLPASANDGFGGLSSVGLTFDQTDAVEMVEENLFISIDKVTVDHVFRNTTGADVTGEVIFPLPPVPVWAAWESSMNLPPSWTSSISPPRLMANRCRSPSTRSR